MQLRLFFIILVSMLSFDICSAQQKSKHKPEQGYVVPDTILIRTDKGQENTTRYYAILGKDLLRVTTNNATQECDTTFFDGLDEWDLQRYNSEVYHLKLRQKPIEQINDREAFYYFEVGDSLEYFLSKLGTKKIHLSYTGYQLTFPDELTGKPQVIEYQFWSDGILHGIERITKINSLPTNDVWTAFQLIQIKESLNDLEKAVDLLRTKNKSITKSRPKTSTPK